MNTRLYSPRPGGRIAPFLLIALIAGAIAWLILRPRSAPISSPTANLIAIGGNTMGGTWSIKLRQLPASQTSGQLQSGCQAILNLLEKEMSTYREDSDLSQFNRHANTDWFPVPSDLAKVVQSAQEVTQQAAGAFDITIAPLVNLWGFGPTPSGLRTGTLPTDDAITSALHHVGNEHLHVRLNPPALRKDDPLLRIDLSGIAKGYAADRLAAALDALNITDYLIAVGGENRAQGAPSPSHPWRVGIEVPTPDTHRILRTIELHNAGVSTSGDYRNFFDVAKQRFSHEIDPHTGRPIINALASVSVVHPNSAQADALATALMVLGPEKGYALAIRLHLAALFVTRGQREFHLHATPEFQSLMHDSPATETLPSSRLSHNPPHP